MGTHFVKWLIPAWLAHRLLIVLVAGVALLPAGLAFAEPGGVRTVALERDAGPGAEALLRWRALVEDGRGLSELERLRSVNDFFNFNVGFASDEIVWGAADYWATPQELLSRGLGDCEDYSIGKYVTLGLLGVPLERMRITYVRADTAILDGAGAQAHMVLAYYPTPGADPLILDNLVDQVLPASRRPDLQPVFGFNSEGLWIAGVRTPGGPTARLSRWRDLLRRLAQEERY